MGTLKVLSLILVLALAAVLILAAIRDSRHYIIDNRTVLGVLALGAAFYAVQALLPAEARVHPALGAHILKSVILAIAIFALAAGLFAFGLMGGGDVKLIAAMMIWSGPALAPAFLLLTALAGGCVSAVVLLRARLHGRRTARAASAAPASPGDAPSQIINPLSASMSGNWKAMTTTGPSQKVPYGLGICVGGLHVAWVLLQQTAAVM